MSARWCGESVSVVLGLLDGVVAAGVATLLGVDRRVRILACGLTAGVLEDALGQWEPQVAVLGETADRSLVERLRSTCPQTGLLVLAFDPTQEHGMGMLAAGANCVARNAPGVDVCALVHLTAQGRRFFASVTGERVERGYPADAEPLTGREREVLVLLAKNAVYQEVADELGIAVRTAEMHAANIRRKLRVRDKRELVGMPIPRCAASLPVARH
jgi:DNA-binding NarL/FixJ family response regulator